MYISYQNPFKSRISTGYQSPECSDDTVVHQGFSCRRTKHVQSEVADTHTARTEILSVCISGLVASRNGKFLSLNQPWICKYELGTYCEVENHRETPFNRALN